MAWFALHGLAVETRTDLPEDPGEALLGRLPPPPAGSEADLVLTTRRVAIPDAFAGIDGEWAGDEHLRIRSGPDGVGLRAPGVIAEVRPEGGIDVAIDPAAAVGGLAGVAHGPLLVALLAALRPRGLFHLHAACVVDPEGRSVLVPGESGAGKSTLASALVAAGFGYVGDDVVLLALRADGPRLLALPRDFHLAPLTARAIPGAAERLDVRRSLGGKHLLDPRRLFPGRERSEAPGPSAILFPRVSRRPATVVAPLPPVEALGRLVECSALVAARGLPGTAEQLKALAALVDGAQLRAVELGMDLLEDPPAVASLIAAAALPGRPGR